MLAAFPEIRDLGLGHGRARHIPRLQSQSGMHTSRCGYTNYRARKQRVDLQREQFERADLQRKFLIIHRREINKQHVLLHCETNKRRMRYCRTR